MKISDVICFAIAAVGAVICYGAGFLVEKILKKAPEDVNLKLKIKLGGFLITLVAVLALFIK